MLPVRTRRKKDNDEEDSKVLVSLLGPRGEEEQFESSRFMETWALRNMIATQIRVPKQDLELEFDGKVLWEAHGRPFEWLEEDELEGPLAPVVQWSRGNRLRTLLEHRQLCSVNDVGKFARTALHFATIDGDFVICDQILRDQSFEKCTLDLQDAFGDTAMTQAAILGFSEIVSLLIERRADIELPNRAGRTAIMLAAEHGHDDAVRELLEAGAKLLPGLDIKGATASSLKSPSRTRNVVAASVASGASPSPASSPAGDVPPAKAGAADAGLSPPSPSRSSARGAAVARSQQGTVLAETLDRRANAMYLADLNGRDQVLRAIESHAKEKAREAKAAAMEKAAEEKMAAMEKATEEKMAAMEKAAEEKIEAM